VTAADNLANFVSGLQDERIEMVFAILLRKNATTDRGSKFGSYGFISPHDYNSIINY